MSDISINPNTNEKFLIPENIDDSKLIEDFIKRNKDKKIIVVQGLGFVGSVMSIVCANSPSNEYAVIGIDLPSKNSYWKIKSINNGIFPLRSSDPKVEEYFKNTLINKNFIATTDTHAYKVADNIIVDINLDVEKNTNDSKDLNSFDVDLTGFKKAIKSIADRCKEDALILIETTVPPGATKLAYDIISEQFLLRGLDSSKIKLGHSYERVMPGPNYIDSIQNFYRVYSGINNYSEIEIKKFLKSIISTEEYPLTKLNNTNATEMAKVLENSYRAMNISFIVEWSRYAEEAGVNLYEVVEAIRMRPTHKNMMLPGLGVGGYCLTKDPLLASWSKRNIFKSNIGLNMSEKAVETNDKMPINAFQHLQKYFDNNQLKDTKTLMLGVSYAPDIGDTRYSPVETFYKYLSKYCLSIELHDPYLNYWEELSLNINDDEILIKDDIDLLIITTGHSLYRNNKKLMSDLLSHKNIFIYDTIGIFSQNEIKQLQKNHTIKILGRGDL